MISTVQLPDDASLLKAMLVEHKAEIERLKFIIAKLRRIHFGRRSEQMDDAAEQLPLALEAAASVDSVSPMPLAPIDNTAHSNRRSVRRPLPAHLPRETVEHAPESCACPDCGGTLKQLGEDCSEMLEYVPAHFKVVRHLRPKLACSRCDRIVQAAAPSRPIARGLPGPKLLSHVLVGKFCDHLPLYRQSAIYARSGVELDRSTLADWVGQSEQLLSPLVDALRR